MSNTRLADTLKAAAAQRILAIDKEREKVLDQLAADLHYYAGLGIPKDDPRRFDFAPEPDEDDATRSCFGFGRDYGNDKVRYHRGPRRPAGRAY